MRKFYLIIIALMFIFVATVAAQKEFEEDIITTSKGDLKITFIGHGTLMFTFAGKVIHVDPVTGEADYSQLPKADLILVTHEHGDHLDTKAIDIIRPTSSINEEVALPSIRRELATAM